MQSIWIVMSVFIAIGLLVTFFGSKPKKSSPSPAHTPAGGGGHGHDDEHSDGHAHGNDHDHHDKPKVEKPFWKSGKHWFWFVFLTLSVATLCYSWMQAPPPPIKVWGPTEVLYTLKVYKPNGDRSRMSNPNTIVTIQTEANFECWFPTQDGSLSEGCRKCVMSQKFAEGETVYGDWSGEYDGGTHKGKFLIFKNPYDYKANKRCVIRGHFWDEGQDPHKDPPHTFTLYPTEPTSSGYLPEHRTVSYWIHQL